MQGAKGRTVTELYAQEWELAEVVDGRRFVFLGWTPVGEGTLSFAWDLEDEGSARMTQKIRATGPQTAGYMDEFRQMEKNAPGRTRNSKLIWICSQIQTGAKEGLITRKNSRYHGYIVYANMNSG